MIIHEFGDNETNKTDIFGNYILAIAVVTTKKLIFCLL